MKADTVQGMLTVIEDCMGDQPAYCHSGCPMHTDAKAYVNLIGEGKYTEAVQLIREQLFLPRTLGRVCAHPCEDQCKRNELGNPISIAALKRFVGDNYDNESDWDLSREADRAEKVAVIGSGPAGAQAALDLRRKGYQVSIFEKLPVVGGMLYVGIPSYRLPRTVITEEYTLLEKLGVRFEMGVEVGKDISFQQILDEYDGVVVAIGAHKGFKLPLPGNELPGVVLAADFLREVSLSSAYAGFGKKVTVIGGGNVALDAARTAARLGAEEVHLVCLERDINEMAAHNWEVEEAVEEAVQLHSGWGTVAFEGKDTVERIQLKKCIQVFDAKGRFNPIYDEAQLSSIETDLVIFAVGQGVESEFATPLEVSRGGHFVVDNKTLQTNIRKVFATGDATGLSVIAVEAMAEGRIAAESVHRFLNRLDLRANRENERAYKTQLETIIPAHDTNPERIETNKLDPATRVKSFAEVDLGLTEAQALEEASRCLVCECRLCVKECLMLQEYANCPKSLFKEALKAGSLEAIIPYSCTLCSTCTLVCPKDLELKNVFMGMRKEMVLANKGASPMKGHKAINMHQLLGFSRFFTTIRPAKAQPAGNGRNAVAANEKTLSTQTQSNKGVQ